MADSPKMVQLKYLEQLKLEEISKAQRDLIEIINKQGAEETGFPIGSVIQTASVCPRTIKITGFTRPKTTTRGWIIHGNNIRKDKKLGRKTTLYSMLPIIRIS